MGKNVLKTIATGDMFITRRIAKDGYEGFEEVRDCIMEHDVKFSNLEMTFHDQEGYPESGNHPVKPECQSASTLNCLRTVRLFQYQKI